MDGVAERGLAIEIPDLVVRYGRRDAVNGLNLEVPRGSAYGFLGPNQPGRKRSRDPTETYPKRHHETVNVVKISPT